MEKIFGQQTSVSLNETLKVVPYAYAQWYYINKFEKISKSRIMYEINTVPIQAPVIVLKHTLA